MKLRYLLVLPLFLLFSTVIHAQTDGTERYADSLNYNLQLLKRYLTEGSNWHFIDPQTQKRLTGLTQFVENEPIDSIIGHLNNLTKQTDTVLIFRYPEDAPDSLSMPGYISYRQLSRQLAAIEEEVNQEFRERPVTVPDELIKDAETRVSLIPEGLGMQLFTSGIYKLPDSLKVSEGIPEGKIQKPEDFQRILYLDSLRRRYVESKRIHYNDAQLQNARKRVTEEYRQQLINDRISFVTSQKIEAVKRNNTQVLNFYNSQMIWAVNDSVRQASRWLMDFADLIDNSTINLVNLSHASSSLVLSNAGSFFTRIWLKNQQNDSLSVLAQNIDKHSMQLVIEDQDIFAKFKQQAVNDFNFSSLNRFSTALEKVGRSYQAYTPWTLGGNGTAGFTQTYLSNWKPGGESSLSILIVMKGFANYSSDKLKWENSAEIRNGWIKPGSADIQKNDDKLELTSRIGITAFQKWYYSAETDFTTQFFNGYNYPNKNQPISAFMAPGKLMCKIGLDYKPNPNFSLLISPLTSKLVVVNDTLKVNKANYGIKPGKKFLWEPGLNTDLLFKKNFSSVIGIETKYKMFINYLAPFDEFDVEWENTLNVQITSFIKMQVMARSIYDTNVLFAKLDKNGNTVMKPRLQFKEFFTIGFTYGFNKQMVKAREVKGSASRK